MTTCELIQRRIDDCMGDLHLVFYDDKGLPLFWIPDVEELGFDSGKPLIALMLEYAKTAELGGYPHQGWQSFSKDQDGGLVPDLDLGEVWASVNSEGLVEVKDLSKFEGYMWDILFHYEQREQYKEEAKQALSDWREAEGRALKETY